MCGRRSEDLGLVRARQSSFTRRPPLRQQAVAPHAQHARQAAVARPLPQHRGSPPHGRRQTAIALYGVQRQGRARLIFVIVVADRGRGSASETPVVGHGVLCVRSGAPGRRSRRLLCRAPACFPPTYLQHAAEESREELAARWDAPEGTDGRVRAGAGCQTRGDGTGVGHGRCGLTGASEWAKRERAHAAIARVDVIDGYDVGGAGGVS